MSFLSTLSSGMYSPTLYIRAGVYSCTHYTVPDSGRLDLNAGGTYNPNWQQLDCLKQQNARINGRYSLESNFEQGYFNFENWSGQKCYDTLWNKSGYQSNVGADNNPYLINFWGNNNTVTGINASYKHGYETDLVTAKQKNITTSVVMSGISSDTTKKLEIYTGSAPSGDITLYGRVGIVNTNYSYDDKILGFGNTTGGTTNGSTAWTLPTVSYDIDGDWTNPDYILLDDGSRASAYTNIILEPSLCVTPFIGGRNFGFNLSGQQLVSIEVTWDAIIPFDGSVIVTITSDSGASSTSVSTSQNTISFSGTMIPGWNINDVCNENFRVDLRFVSSYNDNLVQVNFIKVKINYISFGSTNAFDLYMRNINGGKYLCWKKSVFGQETWVGLNSEVIENNNFSNFLMTYTDSTGYASFYYGKDNQPLTLRSIESVGDISDFFNGKTNFYEESHANAALNNPKIISDYGVSSRAWGATDVYQFNQHRLNPAYYLTESVTSNPPTPSGSDTTSVNFHFPIRSSGTLGSCHSSNYQAINYYIPLNSGVSDRFYEFDRSQFNSTAVTLDMWVENSGTNPSGNLGARIDFCDTISVGGYDYYITKNYWSGFPITINNDGIHQVRMSGLVFNESHGLSDLYEVTKSRADRANLYMGAWYNNINAEYNGDIKVYSTKVKLDAWCTPPRTGNAITLYTSGQVKSMESLDLYLQQSTVWDGLDLYIQGCVRTSGSFPLFIAGDYSFNQFPLYIQGHDTLNSGIPLSIVGGYQTANMPLYINCDPYSQSSGTMPLYLWATTNSGISSSTTLFIGENAPSGVQSAGMNLYINGPNSARVTAAMPLFIKKDVDNNSNYISLYCHNAYAASSGYLTLYLQAPSGTLGAVPSSGAMNLFIARDTESVAHNFNMFISGPQSGSDSIAFYINGSTPYFSSFSLYTDGKGVAQSDTLKLYTHGF